MIVYLLQSPEGAGVVLSPVLLTVLVYTGYRLVSVRIRKTTEEADKVHQETRLIGLEYVDTLLDQIRENDEACKREITRLGNIISSLQVKVLDLVELSNHLSTRVNELTRLNEGLGNEVEALIQQNEATHGHE